MLFVIKSVFKFQFQPFHLQNMFENVYANMESFSWQVVYFTLFQFIPIQFGVDTQISPCPGSGKKEVNVKLNELH
jgi:hypothetical protein